MRADAVAREFERLDRGGVGRGIGLGDIVPGDGDAECAEIGLVEFQRVIDERLIALGANACDDVAHHRLDIGRHLPLGG